jgi:hypothetical protein
MKYLFLVIAMLLATQSAVAQPLSQPSRPASLAASLPTPLAAPDTVAALHRLFAAKRKRNSHFFIGTLGVAALGGVVVGTAPSTWAGLDQAVLGIAIIALVGLPAMVAEVVIALDYNKKSEQQAIESFQARKLPRYLKRKMKAKYFQ